VGSPNQLRFLHSIRLQAKRGAGGIVEGRKKVDAKETGKAVKKIGP